MRPNRRASLRQLAHRQRERETAHTFETTGLVHEAYLTLAKKTGIAFADRRHFYAYMSQVMRHALIDRARRRNAQKRQRIDEQTTAAESDAIDVLALDQALTRLAETDPRLARVAELRLFADLSSAEIAEVVAVTERTVERDWLKARTFLHACLATGA